jgi:S1-C subfamily serine protease
MDFNKIEKSIVKISCQELQKSYVTPWVTKNLGWMHGSGVIIEFEKKLYILTNAHVVGSATNILVRTASSETKFRAIPLFVMYECDLAILDIDDKDPSNKWEFYNNSEPLTLCRDTTRGDEIFALGYPLGGYNVSITRGLINKVEMIHYYDDIVSGISLRIDASLNSGNSGGPIINSKREIVGITVSKIIRTSVTNIGHAIPATLVKFFLNRFKKQEHGLCSLHISVIKPINDTIKKMFSITGGGVIVSSVGINSPFYKKLKYGDTLLSLDDIEISNSGKVSIQDVLGESSKEKIGFSFMAGFKDNKDKICAQFMRDGKKMEVRTQIKIHDDLVPLLPQRPVPLGVTPNYYFIMGLVFVPLTYMVLKEKFSGSIPDEMLSLLFTVKKNPDDELIFLSTIFANEYTKGYEKSGMILHSVNNVGIKNLEHLKQVVARSAKSKFLVFSFSNQLYAFNNGDLRSNAKLMEQFQVSMK